MKIIISGGTGFVGKPLINTLLHEGHSLVLLSRNPLKAASSEKLKIVAWDAKNVGNWSQEINGCDAVINLAGEGIAGKRWSADQKRKLLSSRLDSTHAIFQAISQASQKPQVLINASAIGFYGNVPSLEVDESSPRGNGFLPELCDLWEKEALKSASLGVRTVAIRIGIVLEREGGALGKMLIPFRLGLGGPVGTGKQWMSWIHREDLIQMILYALKNEKISGPVNATSPEPVTMKTFASVLGKTLHRPAFLPAPGFAIKLLLGEMSSILLEGQKVIPKKMLDSGFDFKYKNLKSALQAILQK